MELIGLYDVSARSDSREDIRRNTKARVDDSLSDDSPVRNKPAARQIQKPVQILEDSDFESPLPMHATTKHHAKRVRIQEETSFDDSPVPPVVIRRERNTNAELGRRVERQLSHLEDMVVRMQDQVTSKQASASYDNYQPNRGPSTSEQQRGNVVSETNERNLSNSPRYKSRGRRDERYQKDIICFNCSQTGHISRNCREPRKPDRRSPDRRGAGVRTDQRSRKSSNTNSEVRESSSPVPSLRREAYLDVRFRGKTVCALLDSGAERCVVGRQLVSSDKWFETEERLNTADGTPIPLLGELDISFEVSGEPARARVVVSEVITELILGIDWLQHNRCVWDFGNNSFTMDGHRGRLRCRQGEKSIRRLVVSHDIEIPARQMVEVPVWVTLPSLNLPEGTWVADNKVLDTELIVASTIYEHRDIDSVCRIINLSDHPRRFKLGDRIATAEEAEVVGEDRQRGSSGSGVGQRSRDRNPHGRGVYVTRTQEKRMPSDRYKGFNQTRNGYGHPPGNRDSVHIDYKGCDPCVNEENDFYSDGENESWSSNGESPNRMVDPHSRLNTGFIRECDERGGPSVNKKARDSGDTTGFVDEMMAKISIDLDDRQHNDVGLLLVQNQDVFSHSDYDLGRTGLVKHRIDTGDARPFKQQLRRHPMSHLDVIDDQVETMLKTGVCEPSTSPWASNVVLVKKSDGTLRFCVDYRQLNSMTVKDSYPLPRIDTCFDALGGAKYFSTLDLRQGYWQVENDPETADKTTFITRKGAFKFKVFPFGLSNAPAIFQRLMNLVMVGLTWEACLVFLDDIIVMSSTFEQHLDRLQAVFNRLRSANLNSSRPSVGCFRRKSNFLEVSFPAMVSNRIRRKLQLSKLGQHRRM